MKSRETFVQRFRRDNGRDPTQADIEQILREGFGIEPDAEGYYHRHDFEPFWKALGAV